MTSGWENSALSYTLGIIPCYVIDHFAIVRVKKKEEGLKQSE